MVNHSEADLDRIFAALADPSRRRLIVTLREGESSVEELGRPLGISTPGVMKHIAVLERSGLVSTEKRGRTRYCRLHADRLTTAEEWMAEVKDFWSANLNRLAQHLEEME